MKQLTITQKLSFGFTLAVITLSIVAATGITQLLQVDGGYRLKVLPQVEHEATMVELDEHVYALKILQIEFSRNKDAKLMTQASHLLDQSATILTKVIANTEEATEKENYQEIKNRFEEQARLLTQLEDLHSKKGLNATLGQQGIFNKYVSELNQYFTAHNFGAPYISLFRVKSMLSGFRGNKRTGKAISEILDQMSGSLSGNPKLKILSQEISQNFAKYQKGRGGSYLTKTKAGIRDLENKLKRGYVPSGFSQFQLLRNFEKDFLTTADLNLINNVHQAISDLTGAITVSGLRDKNKAALQKSLDGYYDQFNLLMETEIELVDTNDQLANNATLIHQVLGSALNSEQAETKKIIGGIQGRSKLAVNFMAIASGIGVITIILFAIIFIRKISQLLIGLIANLNTASNEVAQASNEISNSSIELSQGASTQAAAFEQTSAAIEELSSQTQHNADTATATSTEMTKIAQMVKTSAHSSDDAFNLANEAKAAAEQGVESMGKINKAMGEIAESGHKIGDIIAVINEITQQTKMLATNAAIEAARAGESGKGFAVVADEVSKLAEDSKSAAKEISALIKESGAKTEQGAAQVYFGDQILSNILTKSTEVATIISEIRQNSNIQAESIEQLNHKVAQITTASNEQAKGVEQIAQAIVDVDQVTQTNSANAENTASASEELASQAGILQELVQEVVVHVGLKHSAPQGPKKGNLQQANIPRQTSRARSPQTKASPLQSGSGAKPRAPLALAAPKANPLNQRNSLSRGRSVSPKDKIPFNDDFKDF
ncbi:MAG: methyl-accepting chemotaxis protein [SAR324 cluster bacterium]|nr:methyl-accepting chemotaxis protein [SAR324 cluster bacterium]